MLEKEVFISFVVIAHNEASNIGHTLGAITSLAGLGRYEVIVVNDGSTDRTATLSRTSPSATLLSGSSIFIVTMAAAMPEARASRPHAVT